VLVCYERTSTCRARNTRGERLFEVWANFEQGAKRASTLAKVKAFDQLDRVTFEGTFTGPGSYGHLRRYGY
jgi:hypothetical protein